MKISTIAFIALTLSAGSALAAVSTSQINTQLTQAGYSNVQIEQQGQTYKVTANKGIEVRELVYDVQTGRILSDRIDSNGDGQMDRVVNHPDGNGNNATGTQTGGDDDSGNSGGDNDNDSDNGSANSNDNGNDNSNDSGNDNGGGNDSEGGMDNDD